MNSLQGSFSPSKKPQKKVVADNPYEKLDEKEKGVMETVASGAGDAVKSMWDQILGADKYAGDESKQSGELKPGQALDLTKKKEQKSPNEAPMSYFKEIQQAGKSSLYKESAEIRQQVQGIMYELKRLAGASKAIEQQVTQAVGTGVVNPGKYHVTFFEWMFVVIRDARKKVENAGAWLGTVKGKKGLGFNKKNMSHLMSGERSASNQTG